MWYNVHICVLKRRSKNIFKKGLGGGGGGVCWVNPKLFFYLIMTGDQCVFFWGGGGGGICWVNPKLFLTHYDWWPTCWLRRAEKKAFILLNLWYEAAFYRSAEHCTEALGCGQYHLHHAPDGSGGGGAGGGGSRPLTPQRAKCRIGQVTCAQNNVQRQSFCFALHPWLCWLVIQHVMEEHSVQSLLVCFCFNAL